jgi:CHAT domain-containing protein/tetratricopeptide (TPR) repeat protein
VASIPALVLVLTISAVATTARAVQPARSPDAEIDRAEAMYRRSEYRLAEPILTRLQSLGDLSVPQRARVLLLLTATQVELGRYQDALRSADEGETNARQAGDIERLIRLEIFRGSAWRFQGFPYRGVQHYERALEMADRNRRDDLRGQALSMLASVHQDLGDWSRTLDFAERAFEANPKPSDYERFWYFTNRGIAYYEFHDRERADESFRQALAVAQQAGDRRSESVALGELGLVAWEFDRDRARALELYERAAAIAREIGVGALEATWLNNAANVFRDSGQLQPALDRYRAALAIEEKSGRGRQPAPLKNIGQVLSAMGRTQEAEPWLLEALAEADRRNNARIRWQARMELGGIYSGTDPSLADRYFGESLEALEANQSSALLEGFRIGVLGRALDQYDPYDRYIRFLLDRGEDARAFAVAERARARVFLESLTAARAELAREIPSDYLQAETDLLQRISARQSRLRDPSLPPTERRTLAADIQAAEQDLTRLRLRLATDRPGLADARFARVWLPDEVRGQVLNADDALAMFFLGRDRSWAWVVDRRGTEVLRLPPRSEIETMVRRLLSTLQSPEATVDEGARTWLSQTLVAPILARVPENAHLVVVPHAILGYVPFEALADDAGRHLVERNTISYAPSVSTLAFLRRRASDSRMQPGILAIGSPVTSASAQAQERAGSLEWVGLLKPLPFSGDELRRIATTFRPHARVLEGHEATEDALHAAGLGEIAILHFATHALIDEERPERSGLALSAGGGTSDGILQTREIYRLRLDAALVTLSACQTALGRDVTGEGLVGMSRAFFHAGANAVTASLWNVSDASTSDLMAGFYERVRAGASLDRALADAKRAFLRGGSARRHPYYWAPFILTGHARVALPFSGPPLVSPYWLAAGAACALAGAIIVRRLTRRRRAPARA